MKFRKKPVEIDAIQFNGSQESYRNIVDELNIPENEIVFDSFNMEINIQTLEGIHIASHDDWIIKGVKGEFYPCKPDIFELTYEKVDVRLCEICGKEMMQVDCDFWVCPDYPHNAQEEYDCSIDDESHFKNELVDFKVDPDGLYCPGCGKPKVLCLHDTSGCS